MTDLLGRTFVVTGASSGIGRATAHALGGRGATVVLVARSEARLRAVARETADACDGAKARLYVADLSLVSEADDVARRIARDFGAVDVLINNVGAIFPAREVTTEGFERTFALNHLGVFTLTRALLDSLRAGRQPRVVTVSSQVHADRVDPDDLQLEDGYGGLVAYRQSKLLNLLFNAELHRRHGDWLFTAALHPGVVDTPLLKSYDLAAEAERRAARGGDLTQSGARRVASGLTRALRGSGLFRTVGVRPEDGALTSVHVATSALVVAHPGRYWRDARLSTPSPAAENVALAEALWQRSERYVRHVLEAIS